MRGVDPCVTAMGCAACALLGLGTIGAIITVQKGPLSAVGAGKRLATSVRNQGIVVSYEVAKVVQLELIVPLSVSSS